MAGEPVWSAPGRERRLSPWTATLPWGPRSRGCEDEMWGGSRIARTPPPGPSSQRRSPPQPARTSTRRVVRPAHLVDYDCSGEELQRRRRGRVRASDLWTQPDEEEGGELEEEAAGEEALSDQEDDVQAPHRASAQHDAEEAPVVVHPALQVIEGDDEDEGRGGGEDEVEGNENNVEIVAGREGDGGDVEEVQPAGEEAEVVEGRGVNDDEVPDQGGPNAEGDNVEGRLSLAAFLDPLLPVAKPAGRLVDSDGFELIDRLGAQECILATQGSLEEVPFQHQAGWRAAFVAVIRRWSEAVSEEEEERALKWLLFLPQALLRNPRRGGKRGRNAVASRFSALSAGDWGSLVEQYKAVSKFLFLLMHLF